MHAINAAEIGYYGTYPNIGFPATLGPLGGPSPCIPSAAHACFIDDTLATNGTGNGKGGYSYGATGSAGPGSFNNNQFYATATPTGSLTGTKAYCSADDLVVRLQPPGNITLVPGYGPCLALTPMNN
jgi:hypothetical protein